MDDFSVNNWQLFKVIVYLLIYLLISLVRFFASYFTPNHFIYTYLHYLHLYNMFSSKQAT